MNFLKFVLMNVSCLLFLVPCETSKTVSLRQFKTKSLHLNCYNFQINFVNSHNRNNKSHEMCFYKF